MGQDTREIRREVDEAREHLADTVEALAHKVSAPRRAKDRIVRRARAVRGDVAARFSSVRSSH